MGKNLLDVLNRKTVDRVPVWVMRQAGRYLPEFREIKEKHSFFEMVETPELASEITVQPIRRYNMDAAIIFSDILILLPVINIKVTMEAKRGPVLEYYLNKVEDIQKLTWEDEKFDEKFAYLTNSIKLTKKKIPESCALIGFVGSPFTLFAYMTNNPDSAVVGTSRTYAMTKNWLYSVDEKIIQDLMERLTNELSKLLILQYEAGADVLMVFDSLSEFLNLDLFKRFNFPYLEKLYKKCREKVPLSVPIMIYSKGLHYGYDLLLNSDCYEAVGLDWTVDIIDYSNKSNKVIMGNFDPVALNLDDEKLKQLVTSTIQKMKNKGKSHYIANLGHGIYPNTDPEKLKVFVDAVKQL